jgi:hypothetical protein
MLVGLLFTLRRCISTQSYHANEKNALKKGVYNFVILWNCSQLISGYLFHASLMIKVIKAQGKNKYQIIKEYETKYVDFL